MATQTTGVINSGTGALATKPQAFYDRTLLEVRRLRTFYNKNWAQSRPMPKRAGDTINFRKITALDAITTPLTEGVTPSGNSASLTSITATTDQYGDFIEFSDLVDIQQVDDVLKAYVAEQGFQANESLDTLTREELNAGSNVFYANGKTARNLLAAGDIATLTDFRKIVLQMKKDHVRGAEGGRYVALLTPDTAFDIQTDPDFEKMMQFSMNGQPLQEGKIADMFNIRFVEDLNGKTFAAASSDGKDVHASIVLGNQAYGITTIQGEGDIKAIYKALGSSGTSDPLNQRQTVGWKVNAFVAKRLDETAIGRLECVPSQA